MERYDLRAMAFGAFCILLNPPSDLFKIIDTTHRSERSCNASVWNREIIIFKYIAGIANKNHVLSFIIDPSMDRSTG
jgi:hypothetical protein